MPQLLLLDTEANHRHLLDIPCSQEGRVDRHETLGAGSDGRVVSQDEWCCERRSRVVLVPRCWRQVA